MSICKVVSSVVEKRYLLWLMHSLGRIQLTFTLPHFVLQGQTCLLLHVYQDFLLLPPSPWWWIENLFLGVSSRKSSRSSQNWSISASSAWVVIAQTRIQHTVMLNSLPWKWTEIIVSFLRLHPSTVFWTLLLILRATLFLPWDSYPQ